MNIGELQTRIELRNRQRGYTTDVITLTLGVCEEAGELAKAVNMKNPLYVPRKGSQSDSIEHELGDLLVYLVSVANACEIDLETHMEQKLSKP